jgi:hypothetical protein
MFSIRHPHMWWLLVGLTPPAKELTDWDHLYICISVCHLPLFPIMLTDATSFKCTAVCSDLLDHLMGLGFRKGCTTVEIKTFWKRTVFFNIIMIVSKLCRLGRFRKFWAQMPFRPLISCFGNFWYGVQLLYSGDLVKKSCYFQQLLLCFKFYFLLSNINSAITALQTQCTLLF